MLRMVCVALALASLGACASLGPRQAAFDNASIASFDATENAAAPVQDIAAVAVRSLHRQRFSLPSERQPDLRMIAATSYDRRSRPIGRRRCKRIKRARR